MTSEKVVARFRYELGSQEVQWQGDVVLLDFRIDSKSYAFAAVTATN